MKQKQWKIVLFFCVCIIGIISIHKKATAKNIEKKVVRFHVRANSDSKKDQEEKLRVRDAVVDYMRPYMEQTKSKEEAIKVLKTKKQAIRGCAKKTLKNLGNEQEVKVSLVKEKFPTKTYGQYEFPKGTYDAIRVDIGRATGHNWWCVMFPDLCVTKDDKVKINQKGKEMLEKVLGEKTVKNMEQKKYLKWLFQ